MRALCFALALLAVLPVAAQPASWLADPGATVDARYGMGRFLTYTDDQGTELGSARTSYYGVAPSVRVPVGERLAVLAAVPVTVFEAGFGTDILGTGSDLNVSETWIGNPYLGVAVGLPSAPGAFEVEAGVWLPLVNEDGVFISSQSEAGFALDRENTEAYKNKTVSVRVVARGEAAVSPLLRVRAEVAPVFSSFTGETTVEIPGGGTAEYEYVSTNLAATGAAFADLRLGAATITGGVRARYEPEAGFDRFFDEVFATGVVGIALQGLPVRPAAHVRAPLAGVDLADPVYGLSLDVPLR